MGLRPELGPERELGPWVELVLEAGTGPGPGFGSELGLKLGSGMVLGMGAGDDVASLPARVLPSEMPMVESEEKEQMELVSGRKSKGSREPKRSRDGGVIIS